ncbi:MAG: hypothetical protein ACXVCN_19745, partial [Bdellovibrio sp.]
MIKIFLIWSIAFLSLKLYAAKSACEILGIQTFKAKIIYRTNKKMYGDKKTKVIVETKKGKPLEDPEHEYLVTSETDVDEDGHIDFFALGHP